MNASAASQMINLVACERDENGMDATAASKENDKNASAVRKKKMLWMRAQRAKCKIWWHASAASKTKMARRKWYGCECSEPDLKCQKEFQRHASAASKTKMVWTRAERARWKIWWHASAGSMVAFKRSEQDENGKNASAASKKEML